MSLHPPQTQHCIRRLAASPARGAGPRHRCSVTLLKMQAPSIPAPAPPASLCACASPGSPGSYIYLQFAKAFLLPQGGGKAFARSCDEFVTSPGTCSSSGRAQITPVVPSVVAPAAPQGQTTAGTASVAPVTCLCTAPVQASVPQQQPLHLPKHRRGISRAFREGTRSPGRGFLRSSRDGECRVGPGFLKLQSLSKGFRFLFLFFWWLILTCHYVLQRRNSSFVS